ncbi:unnamed protein product, partial [marine sediment metagenome]
AMNSPTVVSGKLDNCFQFDGVDQYVHLGDIANFERTDSFSLECWIKTTTSITQVIMKKN